MALREGAGGFPPELVRSIRGLAMACARAGAERAELTRVAEGALTGVDGRPPLLSDLAAFLRGLAAGEIGSRPAGLSPALAGSLGELLKALTEPG